MMWQTHCQYWTYDYPGRSIPIAVYLVRAISTNPQEWTDFEITFDSQRNILSFSQVTNLAFVQIYELCLEMPEPFGEGDAWVFSNWGGLPVEVDPANWTYELEVPLMAWTMRIESKELTGTNIKVAASATDGVLSIEHFMEFTDPTQVTQINIAALITAHVQANLSSLRLTQAYNALPVDVPVDLGEIS